MTKIEFHIQNWEALQRTRLKNWITRIRLVGDFSRGNIRNCSPFINENVVFIVFLNFVKTMDDILVNSIHKWDFI